MIVTSDVGAQMEVDKTYIVKEGTRILRWAHDQLAVRVIHEGEAIGAFIRPQSVVSRQLSESEAVHTIKIGGWWCPDPSEGVELRGGPSDGLIVPLPRGSDFAPAEYVTIPDPIRPPMVTTGDDLPPSLESHATPYRRIGKDSEKDRWVYEATRR